MQQQPQSTGNTQAVSRASSISVCENTQREQRSEGEELAPSSKRPSLLRVPSISNQDVSANNNDVSIFWGGGVRMSFYLIKKLGKNKICCFGSLGGLSDFGSLTLNFLEEMRC